MKRYHVVGCCHTDLAWRGDEEQYATYLEQFVVLLLDLLDRYPDFAYVIEQAYHYRGLEKRRPDLVERLRKHIAEGRVEVVGGMISTMDTNMPCGESNVRNQLMGLNWFRDHMGAEVSTAWMYDAFGCHAQTPQLIAAFGMRHMMGSRFGGDRCHDIFEARGLDGTRMLVAGHDCFSDNLPEDPDMRVFVGFVPLNAQVDALFERAERCGLQGPVMVLANIEDDAFPNSHLVRAERALEAWAEGQGATVAFSTPRRFFGEVEAARLRFPEEFADLNPEFTGTYAQRVEIRMANRRAEAEVLDAEKWLALTGRPWPEALHEVWWELGFVHFHDVFTGSHPGYVFDDVMARLARARALAGTGMEEVFGHPAGGDSRWVRVVNGLPFARADWVALPFAGAAARVLDADGGEVSSLVREGTLRFRAEAGPCAASAYAIEPVEAAGEAALPCECVLLENEALRLTVDARAGVTLEDRVSGAKLLNGARDLLVLQGDAGSFQIERLEGGERHAWGRRPRVERLNEWEARASGDFRDADGTLLAAWRLTFTLLPGEYHVGVEVWVDWRAAGQRLRLKLATPLEGAGDGVYEIPFGVVRRRAYAPGFNRKGEWPAQRFAAVEDGQRGLALVNDGVPGVETLGGTIYTTLLRAPTEVYAGMVPDASSQQHGIHTFRFALYPYGGTWQRSKVLSLAQRWNQPLRAFEAEGEAAMESRLRLDNDRVLLQAVKPPEAPGEEGIVLRLSEGVGERQRCRVCLPGAARAWTADMRERRQAQVPVREGVMELDFEPWQIRTLIVEGEFER